MIGGRDWQNSFYCRLRRWRLGLLGALAVWVVPALGQSQTQGDNPAGTLPEADGNGSHRIDAQTVIKALFARSHEIRAARNGLLSHDVAVLGSRAALATAWSAQSSYLDDANRHKNPLRPESFNQLYNQVGVKKNFMTGTAIESRLSLIHTKNELAPGAENSPFAFPEQTKELAWDLSVRQSLWQNGFGAATRAGLEAGKDRAAGVAFGVAAETEMLAVKALTGMVNVWLARQMVYALAGHYRAQQALVRLSEKQYELGTLALPDLIEARSGAALVKQSLAERRSQFQGTWQQLVVDLQWPQDWLQWDAGQVAVDLGAGASAGEAVCRDYKISDIVKLDTAVIRSGLAQLAALRQDYQAQQSLQKSDLYMALSTRLNSMADGAGTASGEAFGGEYPRYAVTVGWEMVTDDAGNEAKSLSLYQKVKDAELSLFKLRQEQGLRWSQLCSQLRYLKQRQQTLQLDAGALKKREALQSNRFRLGRIPPFELVRAQTAVLDNQQLSAAVKAGMAEVSWQLMATTNHLQDFLNATVAQPVAAP